MPPAHGSALELPRLSLPRRCMASVSRKVALVRSVYSGGARARLSSYRILCIGTSSVAFVNAMTFGALGPYLPSYAQDRFGCTPSQVGFIMGAYPLMNLISSPCCGYLMSRFGRWSVLFTGLLLLTMGTAFYGLATGIGGLYLASALHGTSLSFLHVSSLSLLAAFPERLTDAMGAIEVWSGVALVIGPPLGGMVYPYWGVPGVFFTLSTFPAALMCTLPYLRSALAGAKDAAVAEEGPVEPVAIRKVLQHRGAFGGSVVTVYNYMIIGFLEVALAPHLEKVLNIPPSKVGWQFVVPSIMYSVMAFKAGDVAGSIGIKRTMIWGFMVLSLSLFLHGPSPAFVPMALVSGNHLHLVLTLGMVVFQVGSALAAVPAFTAMQNSVAHLGRGADDAVASVHSIAIGVGEALGPVIGGLILEALPLTPVMGCGQGTGVAGGGVLVRRRGLLGGAAILPLGLGPVGVNNVIGPGGEQCLSAFPMACSLMSCISLMGVGLVQWVMPTERQHIHAHRDKDDDDVDGDLELADADHPQRDRDRERLLGTRPRWAE